ncbi:hypothetical protein EXN65_05630 [Clostridium botulinum]|uniref:hypothetical protein n=1 Tax=Clostridium botulinum TaxID=1491 RepID=UPI00016BB027|nr:hypothetical protein [Clostridium botulinum]EDT84534.1 hypothetical protein CBB_0981 [Clostridium botulinum Bf]MBY6882573.1 hypothetical protein [Clostridium botulinum]NEZ86191.1 hypothetical protein [Clostridium botulinum]NFB01208.1 hypothetical protein [Clostridium botulinum]NFE29981.1 hypothetical protein [Clostridium botulinum]
MSNMSYCRFQNTVEDLEECLNALTDREELSIRENNAAKRMLKNIAEWIRAECIVDGDGEIDYEEIESIINQCKGK